MPEINYVTGGRFIVTHDFRGCGAWPTDSVVVGLVKLHHGWKSVVVENYLSYGLGRREERKVH